MLLRRVAEHVRVQNWTAIALDFLVVVGGIFVGLQVSNWNDARLLRVEEGLLLARLSADFETIDRRLKSHIDEYFHNMVSIEVVIHVVDSDTAIAPTDFSTQLDRVTQVTAPPNRSATFAEMASAGKVDLVHDDNLRRALVVFDEQVDAVKSSFELLQDWRLAYSEPFFNKVTYRINTQETSFEKSGAIQRFDLDEMRADKKLPISLQIMYQINENMYYLLKQQQERAQNVREELSNNGF